MSKLGKTINKSTCTGHFSSNKKKYILSFKNIFVLCQNSHFRSFKLVFVQRVQKWFLFFSLCNFIFILKHKKIVV